MWMRMRLLKLMYGFARFVNCEKCEQGAKDRWQNTENLQQQRKNPQKKRICVRKSENDATKEKRDRC